METKTNKTKNILKKSTSSLFLVKWHLEEELTKSCGLIRALRLPCINIKCHNFGSWKLCTFLLPSFCLVFFFMQSMLVPPKLKTFSHITSNLALFKIKATKYLFVFYFFNRADLTNCFKKALFIITIFTIQETI